MLAGICTTILAASLLAGCDDIPRDPDGTLKRATGGSIALV